MICLSTTLFLLLISCANCFGKWGFMRFHPMMMMGTCGPWSMVWNDPQGSCGPVSPCGFSGCANRAYGFVQFSPASYGGNVYQSTWYDASRNGNYGYQPGKFKWTYRINTYAPYGYGQEVYDFDGKYNFGYNDGYGKDDYEYGDSYNREPAYGRRVYDLDVTGHGFKKYANDDKFNKPKYESYSHGYGPRRQSDLKDKYNYNANRKVQLVRVIEKKMYKPRDKYDRNGYDRLHYGKYESGGTGYSPHSSVWNSPWFVYGQSGSHY